MKRLLTRPEFKLKVFARDNYSCVVCGAPATDAHHIMDRSLFDNGGYYLDNGSSLCAKHHLQAEKTLVLPKQLYQLCGIETPMLPEHLEISMEYDKWANPVLANGTRLKGELYSTPSVYKLLDEAELLYLFTEYVKYPRTYHLSWSDGITSDDKIIKNLDSFKNKQVIVTEKMDGENTNLYAKYIHARSLTMKRHPSNAWVKNFHASIKQDIPVNFRICGENLYAEHSIHYTALQSYFLGFSVWENDLCFDWESTVEWFNLLGITSVPVLYSGIFDEMIIQKLCTSNIEGYVVRLQSSFQLKNFRTSVAKFVRKNHVQTDKHWLYHAELKINGLLKT